jgi:hypothetical protein
MAKKSEFDYDFQESTLWGVSSALEAFQVCIEINHHLGWEMRRLSDFEVEAVAFKRFGWFDRETSYFQFLVKNKQVTDYFLPELKQFDYLLYLEADPDLVPLKEIHGQLKQLKNIFFSLMDVDSLKQKQKLSYLHANE